MKNEAIDRIDEAINIWNTKEDKLKATYRNPNLSNERFLLKDKLEYYKSLKNHFKGNVAEHEKLSYKALKVDIKKLEDRLYPTVVEKLIASVAEVIRKHVDERFVQPFMNKLKNKIKDKFHDLTQKRQPTNHQTIVKDIMQKDKVDGSTVQQQKNQNQAPSNDGPQRLNVVHRSLRNETKQKDNLLNQAPGKQEKRHKHRLH